MIAVEGIWTGKEVRLPEPIHVRPNIRVIVTFLENDSENEPHLADIDTSTRQLLALSGTWEDDRPVETIINDIYESRTSSSEDIML